MSINILYVMGFSRSGSTLLDTVLSNSVDSFGCGELRNLITAMDVRHEYCACGCLSAQCPFWVEVRKEWARNSRISVKEYTELQRYFTRYRRYRYRSWNEAAFRSYRTATEALYLAIQKVSGCKWVVDSSKHPIRALMLSQMNNLNVYVIHLVRDVRGVAYSLGRAQPSNPETGVVDAISALQPGTVARQWLVCNLFADGVRRRLGERALLLRYEDLIKDPHLAMDRISALTSIEFNGLADRLAEGGEFSPGHTVAGNRMRMSSRIQLRRNPSWHGTLSKFQQYALPLMTFPLAYKYGYRPG